MLIRRIAQGFLVLAVVNTFANLFLSDLNLYRVIKLRAATERMENLIKAEEKRNRDLRKVYGKIRENPRFYREKFIREYLLMFREGERVIPLPEELWYRK
ncbi:MAG: hypothetical protein Q9N26_04255 [Aquificota bacterium]|nr:hypothetical protein [Aquificota bacterium]